MQELQDLIVNFSTEACVDLIDVDYLNFNQRFANVLLDLANLEASQDYPVTPEQLLDVINGWTDGHSHFSEIGISFSEEGMKMFTALGHVSFTEQTIEQEFVEVAQATAEVEHAFEFRDELDFVVHNLRHQIDSQSGFLSYLTAVLTDQHEVAHDIIDEEGCVLVHTLTDWFFQFMADREVIPDTGDFTADVLGHFQHTFDIHSHYDSMTQEQLRNHAQMIISHQVGGLFDQDDEEE